MNDPTPACAAISLGNGAEFYITAHGLMGIRHIERGRVKADIALGEATESRLNMLLTHLGYMRVLTKRNE